MNSISTRWPHRRKDTGITPGIPTPGKSEHSFWTPNCVYFRARSALVEGCNQPPNEFSDLLGLRIPGVIAAPEIATTFDVAIMCDGSENEIRLPKLGIVVSGSLADLADVPPGVVGTVINRHTQKEVSECTALTVVVNESRSGWPGRFDALVDAGHDPHKVINWFGTPKTVYDIISSCPSRSRDFAEEHRLVLDADCRRELDAVVKHSKPAEDARRRHGLDE